VIIEFLTFDIDPEERDDWLEVERRTWSASVEKREGFVRKEVWLSDEDPRTVHAVIWWTEMAAWKAIGPEEIQAIDDQMGEWRRPPKFKSFQVLREG